jgi:hypothetical protein
MADISFLDCPEYLDEHGTGICGLPAEVQYRYIAESTNGPLECARIRCPRSHWFNGPIEFLRWKGSNQPALSSEHARPNSV